MYVFVSIAKSKLVLALRTRTHKLSTLHRAGTGMVL